jgi:hypothetical protein
MNFKVKCTKSASDKFTRGKIYEVKDGIFYNNFGFTKNKIASVDAINSRYKSKFRLYIEEPIQEATKQFTKEDLRSGDWCELRDGSMGQVIINEKHRIILFLADKSFLKINSLDMNLSYSGTDRNLDIISVIRPIFESDYSKLGDYGDIVFKREMPIILTISEAEKELSEIKRKEVKVVREDF